MTGTGPGAGFSLRHMHQADLPAVLVVETAAYPYPWTEGIFTDCLRVGYHCLVAEPAAALSLRRRPPGLGWRGTPSCRQRWGSATC